MHSRQKKEIKMKEDNWYVYSLISLFFVALMLRLIMPLQFSVWGPDTGENYYIVHYFAANGNMPQPYYGYGRTYTEFPGVYELLGALSAISGVSAATITELAMPFITSVLVFPVASIARRLSGNRQIALASSLFYSASVIIVGHTSIISSDTMGEVLLIFFLYFYTTMHESVFGYAGMLLCMTAMVPTYHLGMVFTLGFLYIALLCYSFFRRSSIREVKLLAITLAAGITVTLTYWFALAPKFLSMFILGKIDAPAVVIAPYLLIAAILVAGRYSPWQGLVVRGRTGARSAKFYVLTAVLISLTGASIVAIYGLPSIPVEPGADVLLFVPTLALSLIGGALYVRFSLMRFENAIFGAFATLIALIIIAGMITGAAYLVPLRVIEYLSLILAFFAGFGLVTAMSLFFRPARRTTVSVTIAFILILAGMSATFFNTSLSVPSKIGATPPADLDAANWIRWNTQTNATFAGDHRVSSIVFGYGDRNATWEFGGATIFGSNTIGQLLNNLNSSQTPSGLKHVDYVMVDGEMIAAANFYPNQPDYPLNPVMLSMLKTDNFLELYTNGYATVYAYV